MPGSSGSRKKQWTFTERHQLSGWKWRGGGMAREAAAKQFCGLKNNPDKLRLSGPF